MACFFLHVPQTHAHSSTALAHALCNHKAAINSCWSFGRIGAHRKSTSLFRIYIWQYLVLGFALALDIYLCNTGANVIRSLHVAWLRKNLYSSLDTAFIHTWTTFTHLQRVRWHRSWFFASKSAEYCTHWAILSSVHVCLCFDLAEMPFICRTPLLILYWIIYDSEFTIVTMSRAQFNQNRNIVVYKKWFLLNGFQFCGLFMFTDGEFQLISAHLC